MYKKQLDQLTIFDMTLEDSFKLDPNNRWIKKSKLVPWEKAEEKYAHLFRKNGRPAKDIRIALGALIIQQTLELSDEETVQMIEENPYLQYFIGQKGFSSERPFDPSLMVWFRKRLSLKFMAELNEEMLKEEKPEERPEEEPENTISQGNEKGSQPNKEKVEEKEDDDKDDPPRGGTLILDATCTPADITYPTDTGLIRKAIEKTEKMIDKIHQRREEKEAKPRTYRKEAKRVFNAFIKKRKPNKKTIMKCKKQQLRFLKRNLKNIESMTEKEQVLTEREQRELDILKELYRQQNSMYQNRTNQIENRIVSLSQPHIRPIVRGKAGSKVEFGAKVEISVVKGYTYVEKISFDNYNEGKTLEESIQNYQRRFEMLPKEILVDQIYRNRENRAYCKKLGIRMSGKPLGRPPKDTANREKTEREDQGRRNEVEARIGHMKTGYGLKRIMARLKETAEAVIGVAIFAMNLNKKAKAFLCQILKMQFMKDIEMVIAA
ncbi:MAG: IS5 family transposase [Bacillota bacterium]